MNLISYSQNFEDVMLWRSLKHIAKGFYIDVGAAWADNHSVTKVFYEQGWYGINIEPNPEFHELLLRKRPLDINLRLAIGGESGSLEMSVINNTGISTLDPYIARTHQAAGWSIKTQIVDVKTLCQIWEEYVPHGQEVHFLKVDIEGLEEAAIRGNDWTHNRPWIIIVESTLPMSQVESHHTWEPILLQARYRFAYADGLNRFYVAVEHDELLASFKYPPNVFDGFTLIGQVDAANRAAHAEAQVAQANERAAHAEAQVAQANERAAHAEAQFREVRQQYEAIINSRSWNLTKPLRIINKLFQRVLRGGITWLTFVPGSHPRRVMRKMLMWSIAEVRSRPILRDVALRALNRFPALKQRLRKIAFVHSSAAVWGQSAPMLFGSTEAVEMPPRARQIFEDLKSALAKKQRNG